MAVSPLRALLVAHLQSSTQRIVRETGKWGTVVMVALVAVTMVTFALPLWIGASVGGYFAGVYLDGRPSLLGAGFLLTAFAWGGGLVLGIVGGTRQLSGESIRHLPLSPRRFFLIELFASLGDAWVFGAAVALTCLCLGLLVAQPAAAVFIFTLWLILVLAMLTMQSLVVGLAGALVKRLRVAFLVLGVLAWVMTTLGTSTFSEPGVDKEARRTQAAAFRRMGRQVMAVGEWMPGTAAMRGVQRAMRGEWTEAVQWQFGPALLVLLTGIAAYAFSRRELEQSAHSPSSATKLGAWRIGSASAGVGRVYWTTLLGSYAGKSGFLLPLVAAVLLRGPFGRGKLDPTWLIPAAYVYATLGVTVFQLNQFGLDGHGIKTMLLLPVSGEELLRGKAWALAAYQALQSLLLTGLLAWLIRPAPLDLLGGLGVAACMFFLQNAVGQWTSAWMPRRVNPRSFSNKNMAPVISVVSIALTVVGTLVFGGLFALLKYLAPALLVPGMLVMVAACAGVHRLMTVRAAAYLETRRETLVLTLG